jgi:hypothetical protein
MVTLARYSLFRELLHIQVAQLFSGDWKGYFESEKQIVDFNWMVSE